MDNVPILSPEPGITPGYAAHAPRLAAGEVARVRERRASLRRAAAGLRNTLASPPGGGPSPAAAQVAALEHLRTVWAAHSAATEEPGGMLAQVVTDCPRLAPRADRLRREHATVARALMTARATLDAGAVRGTDATSALEGVADAVDRHRAAGRTLLYEAYNVDLGLGE